MSGGEALGVIAVQSERPDCFTDEDMRLLTLLANQSSGAIRNAQTFEATQERARQLRLINDVSRQVTAIQPLPDLFRQIVTLIQDAFGYYAVNIFIVDDVSGTIQLKASSHESLAPDDLILAPGQGLVGWVWSNVKPVIAPNVAEDERFMHTVTLAATRSEICVPLTVQGRVMGVLDVQSNRLDAFGSDDTFMLETLAPARAAIQEAQTYDAERRGAERINAMTEVARALVSISISTTCWMSGRSGERHRMTAFTCFCASVTGCSAAEQCPQRRWALEKLSYDISGPGIIPWVAREGQPRWIGNVSEDEAYIVGPGVEDTLSEMIPIRMGSHVLGVSTFRARRPTHLPTRTSS